MHYNVHKKVIIPETRKTVSLRESRKELAKREAWLGQTQANLKNKILKQRKDFEKLERAIETFNKTQSYAKAGNAAGVATKTARQWLTGKRLPQRVSIAWSKKGIEKRKPLVITPKKAVSFGYVLGGMMGNVTPVYLHKSKKQGRLNMSVSDLSFAKEFIKKLKESTGMTSKLKKTHENIWVIDINATNLIQLFNELTTYSKKVPITFSNPNSQTKKRLEKQGSITSFLQTKNERTEFIRAIYDSRGRTKLNGPSKTKIITIQIKNPELAQFVIKILTEHNLHPTLQKNGHIVIPNKENSQFMETIGFRKAIKYKI
jgi:hypothetical protein